MSRILLAFRAFFAILFGRPLPHEIKTPAPRPAAPAPKAEPQAPSHAAALQLLAILQRDARLVDFLMEDVTAYEDEQIGAAVRSLHDQARDSLARYLSLQPVIDGVEGTYAKAPGQDPNLVKFVGNVPAKPPAGGTLRHKGWRATKVDLPLLAAKQDATIIAAAEIEIE